MVIYLALLIAIFLAAQRIMGRMMTASFASTGNG